MLTREVKVTEWPEGADAAVEKTVVLRKWSALKLLTVLQDVEEMGALLGDDFSLSKSMTSPQLARLIHALGEKAVRKAANLICQSVLKPRDISETEVLSWDLDDWINVLAAVIDMNFSESTIKNFAGLRDTFMTRVMRAPAGGQKEASTNHVAPVGVAS